MEQTLGKRIVQNRKRLNLTQDQLAEKLGVTAQAVSKWENDQSCPDIATLPKLAEIFGISIDALLGAKEPEVHQAELVENADEQERSGIHIEKGSWEFRWDAGRRSGVGFACWVLLLGALLLLDAILETNIGFWSLAWPSGLLMLGLFGGRRFSFFRLGCVLFGAWFLLDHIGLIPFRLGSEILWPALVLLFGLGLLIDALKKPKKPRLTFHHNNHRDVNFEDHERVSRCDMNGSTFECEDCFGSGSYVVTAQQLEHGEVASSFSSTVIDLSGVESVAKNCRVEADCNFGKLVIQVPSHYLVRMSPDSVFGNVSVQGEPSSQPVGSICMECSANFGNIVIQYI